MIEIEFCEMTIFGTWSNPQVSYSIQYRIPPPPDEYPSFMSPLFHFPREYQFLRGATIEGGPGDF